MSAASALEKWVDQISRLTPLSQDERHALLRLPAFSFKYRSGSVINGMRPRKADVGIVVEGLVAQVQDTAVGRRQITAFHIPGDACDLHSYALPGRPAVLVASTATEMLSIPHRALAAVAQRHPVLTEAFWRYSSAKMLILAEWAVRIGTRTARQRLAHLTCELAARCDALPQEGSADFLLRLTQQSLGEALSLTSVHINRMAKAMRDDGMLDITRGRITILDARRLIAEAEFDPTYLIMAPSHNAEQRAGQRIA
ncbi:Crp/Fnr family transcriptional regulator [uncultured Sphingomonas sp.]|uniref:Crp/Fnr family transcriptional regulator n=1 Tax=uncultured Sphingomonas sp. TaxID=158754 RepID=UPI0026023B27|nr:Crp/Fnr family transcriptional regulator [uncultured Sphingomonas sp.]